MTREERNAYYRAYRAKRKAQGLCVRCGEPVTDDRTCCFSCRIDFSKRAKLHYDKKKEEK